MVEASKKLPRITKEQMEWAFENCFGYIGRRTKKGVITCSKCGHSWKGVGYLMDTLLDCHCPNCHTKLEVQTTLKRVFEYCEYFSIITTYKEFQVLRYVMIKCKMKIGEKAEYIHSEVVQRWLDSNGKFATFARLRQTFGSPYYDNWIFHSPLELRQEVSVYDQIHPIFIHPKQRTIPELKRNGFNANFHKLNPFSLFQFLLSDSRAETLIKTQQIALLRYFTLRSNDKMDNYWASIRICLRNNYFVEDASMWCDYIDLLRFFNKDLHNAKYVCPADLKKEHDRYVKKKEEFLSKQDEVKARKRAMEDEEKFNEMKSQFFGIQFTDGLINIRVLDHVADFIEEAKTMHHCVFTNNYHLKPDSLVLSAYIDDKRLETIEFSLSKLQVLQSRGVCNKNTEYHDRILKLMEKNIPQIRQRITA